METEKTTFYRLKNPSQKVPAPQLFHLQGTMIWAVGGTELLHKCLSVYSLLLWQFPSETLYRDAINLGVIDVGRMGTWCHRSGPFMSALQCGGSLFLLQPCSKSPFFPKMIQF